MECVERGWLDEPWLTFGSGDAMLRAIELIGQPRGRRQSAGRGQPARRRRRSGSDSIAFAPQVKGLEIPGYEPRALQTMALGFAVGARGADHNRSGAYEVDFSDKVDRRHVDARCGAPCHRNRGQGRAHGLAHHLQVPARGVRRTSTPRPPTCCSASPAGTSTADELRETARRIVAAKRQFNLLAGWTLDEDTLPERFLNTPLPSDPTAALSREQLGALVAEYHRQRGW